MVAALLGPQWPSPEGPRRLVHGLHECPATRGAPKIRAPPPPASSSPPSSLAGSPVALSVRLSGNTTVLQEKTSGATIYSNHATRWPGTWGSTARQQAGEPKYSALPTSARTEVGKHIVHSPDCAGDEKAMPRQRCKFGAQRKILSV